MAAEERPVQIIADHTQSSSRVYANYVQVSSSPIDTTLTFCEVIGPQSEEAAVRRSRRNGRAARVDRRIALALPFFSMEILAMVIPTLSESSVTLIFLFASITSMLMTMGMSAL